MYEKELQTLGLSEKEAKVFLASLELGPDTVQNIAKKSGINRPTAYVQIESLKKKGLMSEVEKGKKVLYTAESPERLSSLLNSLEKDLDFKKTEIKRILPGLKELFGGAGEKPKVRFYEGVEGFNAVYEDFLKTKDKKIESFVNLDKLFNLFPKHEDEYTTRRVKKGIKTLAIYTRKEGPLEGASDSKKLRTAKFIDEEKFPIAADMTIYDSKVAIIAYKANPVAVIIENKEIADTARAIFYLIWNNL